VIDDSVPWRTDIARTAERLRERLTQQRWHQRTFYLVEKDLMIGFYAIRRLIDSHKTSSRLSAKRIPVRVCPLLGKEPKVFDRWSPWEYFDFESKQRSDINVGSLQNEFIHSFILMLSFSEESKFLGVFVGSDRTKRKQVFEVPIGEIIDLFDYVAREDVVLGSQNLNESGVRLSQHDLVEVGAARYADASRTWHEVDDAFPADGFDKLSDLSLSQMTLVKGAWDFSKRPRGVAPGGYKLLSSAKVELPEATVPGAYGYGAPGSERAPHTKHTR
jgi:hypothetical protein